MIRAEPSMGRKILFGAAVTVLFFGILEGGARLFVPPGDPILYETHRNIITILGLPEMNDIMDYDPRLFWTLKRGLPGKRIVGSITGEPMDFTVSTNRLGLRGPEVGEKRGFRVLAIGNSCTFGMGVQDGETWPARLEAILQERTGTEAEVINAGVPGYTSFQGLRYLEERGLDLEPDLVIACFGFNDSDPWGPDGDEAIAGNLRGRSLDRALSRSRFYRGLAGLIRRGAGEEGGGGGVGPPEARRPRVSADELRRNLLGMKAICEERASSVMFLLWPYRKQRLEKIRDPVVFQPIIVRAGQEAGAPVIDLVGPFVDAGEPVFLDHIHATPAGCNLVGETIADALDRARAH
ncbi:MAG: GDSL-type esterase/lipase family protein [Candidatus Eisenbacteria bacterium]